MRHKQRLDSPLQSKLVALPESRQLDVLAGLFERRQARVLRIPLVAIRDAPDQNPVTRWIKDFIVNPPDYLIILTGLFKYISRGIMPTFGRERPQSLAQ